VYDGSIKSVEILLYIIMFDERNRKGIPWRFVNADAEAKQRAESSSQVMTRNYAQNWRRKPEAYSISAALLRPPVNTQKTKQV